MASTIHTNVFVGGPADGTKIEVRDDQSRVDIAGPENPPERHAYERTSIATEDAEYVFWKLRGMSHTEVLWRLFTRYHGG